MKQKALSLGFDVVGITHAGPVDPRQEAIFRQWLDQGYAGEMAYMVNHLDRRMDPSRLLAGAKSIICVGLNYNPFPSDPVAAVEPTGRIADFALYEDYHPFIRDRLRELAEFIRTQVHPKSCDFKICVDSVPIAERAIAQRAGLGFIARNHMLIHPELGARLLLGEVITTVEIEPDSPMDQPCVDCGRCFVACPTGALSRDGAFDARKCISYLTIEHKTDIPPELASGIGDRIFGCDECVRVCPHQLNAPIAANRDFHFFPERNGIPLRVILPWKETDFAGTFNGSVVLRTGLNRFQRNARIALHNHRAKMKS